MVRFLHLALDSRPSALDSPTGPLGFFAWEVERPHTIFINPLAGIVALAVGIALVLMARSKGASS